jgi:hypothetical protein
MFNATTRYFDDFQGHYLIPLTASNVGTPWSKAVVGSGSPTMVGITNTASGVLKLTVAATSEAEAIELYHGDICSFKADDLQTFACRVSCAANITTNEYLVFGLRSARNDNPDSPTYNVQFKLAASTAVLLETDDGATDTDDTATDAVLSTTMKEFMIDFRNGLSDIRFYASDTNGKMHRLAKTTTFKAPSLSGAYLQPFVVVGKASGTSTPSVLVDYIEVLSKRS